MTNSSCLQISGTRIEIEIVPDDPVGQLFGWGLSRPGPTGTFMVVIPIFLPKVTEISIGK